MTSGSSTTGHADDCGWHVDQYSFECTCSHDYKRGYTDGEWTERALIVTWLRDQKTYWPSDIADAIKAGEHLK